MRTHALPPFRNGSRHVRARRRSPRLLGIAWAFWAACWIGRKGKGGTRYLGGLPSVRRTAGGGSNSTRLKAAAEDLRLWAKVFERCEWVSECFRELLPKVADSGDCGVHCDPPWVGNGADYLHPFKKEDHAELEAALRRFEHTTVVVRYGDCEQIRELYASWTIIDAASRNQANVVKSEIWITNRREPTAE